MNDKEELTEEQKEGIGLLDIIGTILGLGSTFGNAGRTIADRRNTIERGAGSSPAPITPIVPPNKDYVGNISLATPFNRRLW